MLGNGLKLLQRAVYGLYIDQLAKNGFKLLEMAENGLATDKKKGNC